MKDGKIIMSEKTAEEKLREELEGKLPGQSGGSTDRTKAKTSRKPGRSKAAREETSGRVNVRQRAGSFMDDFERKIAQSLNADMFRPPQTETEPERPAKTQTAKKPERTPAKPTPAPAPKPKPTPEPEPQIPEAVPVPPPPPPPPPEPAPQPEPEPVPEAEPEPEETEPEPEPEEEIPPEEPEELPDIPILDGSAGEQNDELPDIPVISADEIDEPDAEELDEDFADIPVIDAEEEPEEPDDDIPESEDDLAAFYEEPDDEPEDFSPPADVVLNVDEDLPAIQPEEPEPDPEAQAAPVSVVMPETTKTAEDKLMADIAEAMTGNPLTLDSPENPEPYKIPENFFALDNNSEAQSAEDKLIANIAQAMSESPLGTAQDQARQSLEEDLNPFDEMPLPEAVNRFDPEPEPAEEPEEQEEAFLPDFTQEAEQPDTPEEEEPEEEEPETEELPSLLDEPEEEETEELNDPFSIPDFGDFGDDEPEEQEQSLPEDLEELPLAEDDVPETEPASMTAQERLAQELAAFQQRQEEEPEEQEEQEDDTGIDMPDDGIDIDTDFQQEEVSPVENMPDDNNSILLDDDDITTENDDDDWDMSSLGALSEAASLPGDEPEDIDIPQPPARTNETEEDHKEKTMGIREKLAAKKNGTKETSAPAPAKKKSSGGFLMPLLVGLLLVAVLLTLLQLRTLNDRITAAMINMGTYDAMPVSENPPSYDYAIDFILDPNINERMALRGRDGWQVVGSRRTQDSTTGQYGYEFIFMRRSR